MHDAAFLKAFFSLAALMDEDLTFERLRSRSY